MSLALASIGSAALLAPGAAEAEVLKSHHAPTGNNPFQVGPAHQAASLSKFRDALKNFAQHKPAGPPARAPKTVLIASRSDSGSGSLRDALSSAVDGDIIDVRNLHGTIMLSAPLQTSASVSIKGPGRSECDTSTAAATAASSNRAFPLKLSNITIANGSVSTASVAQGGCLYVAGDLYLYGTTITNCSVGDAYTQYAGGGAVAVYGDVTLKYSTISNSSATAYSAADGGGLIVFGQSNNALAVISSTVSGNSATLVPGLMNHSAAGGGVLVAYNGSSSATAPIANSTISGNTVTTSTYYYYNPTAGSAYIYISPARGAGIAAYGLGIFAYGATVSSNAGSASATMYGGGVFTTSIFVSAASTIANNTITSVYYKTFGGGVMSYGPSLLLSSIVSGNSASVPGGYFAVAGGGIFSSYGINAKYSTFSGNSASCGNYYAPAAGGAMISVGPEGVYLQNSTVSGNSALNTAGYYGYYGAGALGGGIAVINPPPSSTATLASYNSTIAFNSSGTIDGGIYLYEPASVNLQSTIVASNTAQYDASTNDIGSFAPITISGDHDLVMAVQATVTLPPLTLNSDPLLLPLAYNGGPTQTHALDPTSPAIDIGSNPHLADNSISAETPMPASSAQAADIGAFELDTDRIFANGFEDSYPPTGPPNSCNANPAVAVQLKCAHAQDRHACAHPPAGLAQPR